MTTPWKSRYAQRNQRMGRSIIRELLKLMQDPGIISFAGGMPAPVSVTETATRSGPAWS